MKIIVSAPTITGGASYEPSTLPQDVPDHIGQHLIAIGNATPYQEKVAPPEVTKGKKSSSASQAAPASRKKTATRQKAKPKS